jgi:hypothetical protein
METIEIRCPEDPRRILTKILIRGERPHITEDNLIEIACDSCKVRLRRQGKTLDIVLHRYDLLGELIQTVIK